MVTILPHTTRASGTLLTATIYNADHQNHITNATTINATAAFLNVSNVWTTGQTFNVATVIASTEAFIRSVNTDSLRFAGGTSGLGAKLILTGGAHPTAPNQTFLDADTSTFRNLAGGTPTVMVGVETLLHTGNDSTLADAALLGGQNGAYYRNATNLDSGTVANARLPSSQTGKTFTSDVTIGDVAIQTGANLLNFATTGGTGHLEIDGETVIAEDGNVWGISIDGSAARLDHATNVLFMIGGVEQWRMNGDGNLLSGGLTASKTNVGDSGSGISMESLFWISRANAVPMIVDRSGNDGIAIQFGREKVAVGSITVAAASTAYNTSSDERRKQDFKPINSALLDAIKVYDFEWKDGSGRALGCVAQELIDVVPTAVTPGETPEDMWEVDYSKLVPLLIAKVQDLEVRLAILEA